MRTILSLLLLLASLASSAQSWNENLYRQIEQSIQSPRIDTDRTVDIRRYGASPDATAERNQKAIQKAIDRCAKKGGGRIVVPAGMTFRTGTIELKSGIDLHVEEGAVLEFAFQPELYPVVETSWEGLDCYNLSPCIYALRADDIAITGKGTIDGGGTREAWWPWCGAAKYGWKEGMTSQKTEARPRLLRNGEDGVPMTDDKGKPTAERTFTAKDGLRPQLIGLNQCQRILIEDVTLLRSPFWVIHPLKSTDVIVRRVHINNDGPNGDGCDPESCDRVLIEDCYFNTGDDCIAIKSGRNTDGRRRAMPSQNIIIRRCEMKNGHGGVVVGSEISGGLRNVFAHDCVMDSPNLDRVLRIKTNSCRGGIIENIFMRDIEVGQCREAVLRINLDYEHNEICCRGNYPTVRNVLMENVTCKKSKYGVQIIGLDEDTYVHDITVRNCRFDGVKSGNSITGKTRDVKFDRLFVNGSLALQTAPYKNYSQWMTYSEMKRTPQSYMLDFSKRPKWSYVMGIELESMLDTYLRYGDKRIWDYCQEYTDTMINAKGEIRGFKYHDYNLDNIRTGHFVARMYQLNPEAKNLIAMKTMMRQLKEQPRTEEDGVFWHKAIYSYQVWLDGIFMGLPYNVLTASMIYPPKEAQKIYDDAVDQVKTTYLRTFDSQTGLNRHAWDETHEMFWADKQTGQSQHCWGRAQGWFTMALVELLDALPKDYALREDIIDILRQTLDGVIQWQDKESGVWYQVMDSPDREGNYLESTCSAMFAYSLLKAYRMGYVGDKYRDAGIRAYQGIINNFIRVNEDETISLTNCCSVAGLGPGLSEKVLKAAPKVKENKRRDGSYAYYLSEPVRDNDAKGIGPFIWASLEMERMGYDIETIANPIDRKAVVNRNNPKDVKVKKELVTPEASREARKLYKKLVKLNKSGKVLSGQMWAPWGIDEIKYVHEVTGKYPAVRGHDLIHEGSNAREIELLTDWYRQGGIPTLMWHWGAPTKGEGYEQSKMTIDINRCFIEGTAEHKAMWADLKRAADWLTVLRDNKVPVLWRPMHEFDGRWFWYGKGGGELFVKLWRTMFDYFTKERKLNNLIWVLPHSGQPDTSYNPGREYFDIAGPDTYSEKEQSRLHMVITEMHGKEILIPLHECGTLPSPEKCKSEGTRWSWWMLWHTTHLTGHDKDELRRIYNHEDVITLDEL